METELELIEMLELPNKDLILVTMVIFQMFKKLSTGIQDIEKDLSQTSRDENYNEITRLPPKKMELAALTMQKERLLNLKTQQ